MRTTRNFPVINNDDDVLLGDGFLRMGIAGAEYDNEAMEIAGCLQGAATFRAISETNVLKAGSPNVSIKKELIDIGAELKFTFIEYELTKLQKCLGYGTLTSESLGDVAVTNESVELWQNFYHHLQGYDIKDSPAVVVTDGGATPVEFVEDVDYKIDYNNGLIKRLTAGDITDGQVVYVAYTWARPAYKKLQVGSEKTLNVYPLQFIVPKGDGTNLVYKMWRGTPGNTVEIPHDSREFTKYEITFEAMADRSREVEELLYAIEDEISG